MKNFKKVEEIAKSAKKEWDIFKTLEKLKKADISSEDLEVRIRNEYGGFYELRPAINACIEDGHKEEFSAFYVLFQLAMTEAGNAFERIRIKEQEKSKKEIIDILSGDTNEAQ